MSDELVRKIAALRDEKRNQEAESQGLMDKQMSRVAGSRSEFQHMLRNIQTELNTLKEGHYPEIGRIMTTLTGGRGGGWHQMYLGEFSSHKDSSSGWYMSVVIKALIQPWANSDLILVQDSWTVRKWEKSDGIWHWGTRGERPIAEIVQMYSDQGLSDLAVEHQLQCFDSAKALLDEDHLAGIIHAWLEQHQRITDWHKDRRR